MPSRLTDDEGLLPDCQSCMVALSGNVIDLEDPRLSRLNLGDIAGALSNTCRFGGHVPHFYSVAEHSVHCVELARRSGEPVDVLRAVLLHDAAEAYVGDVPRPLKRLLGSKFQQLEQQFLSLIEARFGVSFSQHADAVSRYDNAMLAAERQQVCGYDLASFGEEPVELQLVIPCWHPRLAKRQFLYTCDALGVVA